MANLEKVGTFVLTDDTLDRHSERILPDGVDLKEFKANPVMFYNHMRSGRSWGGNDDGPRPIGIWKNIRRSDGRIKADAYIHTASDYANSIGQLIKDGIIKAASVGLQVLAVSDDPEDKVKGQKGYTITKSRMLEASIVDIPANPAALRVDKMYSEKAADPNAESETTEKFILKTAFAEYSETEKDDNMDIKNITDRLKAAVNKAFGVDVDDAESALKAIESLDLNEVAKSAIEAHLPKQENQTVEALKTAMQSAEARLVDAEKNLTGLAESVKALADTIEATDEKQESQKASIEDMLKGIAEQINNLKGQPSGNTTVTVDSEGVKIEETPADPEIAKAAKVKEDTIQAILSGTIKQ